MTLKGKLAAVAEMFPDAKIYLSVHPNGSIADYAAEGCKTETLPADDRQHVHDRGTLEVGQVFLLVRGPNRPAPLVAHEADVQAVLSCDLTEERIEAMARSGSPAATEALARVRAGKVRAA